MKTGRTVADNRKRNVSPRKISPFRNMAARFRRHFRRSRADFLRSDSRCQHVHHPVLRAGKRATSDGKRRRRRRRRSLRVFSRGTVARRTCLHAPDDRASPFIRALPRRYRGAYTVYVSPTLRPWHRIRANGLIYVHK